MIHCKANRRQRTGNSGQEAADRGQQTVRKRIYCQLCAVCCLLSPVRCLLFIKMRLWLIRHGETDYNLERRCQGTTDLELNETGKKQASAIARRMAGVTLTAVHSSPLKRAVQTAVGIAEPAGFDLKLEPGEVLYRGVGCKKCRGTGYYGRTGLFELMVVNDAIREKIMQRSPTSEVLKAAKGSGLQLLREDGWAKVREGITTPDEVIRSTKA